MSYVLEDRTNEREEKFVARGKLFFRFFSVFWQKSRIRHEVRYHAVRCLKSKRNKSRYLDVMGLTI